VALGPLVEALLDVALDGLGSGAAEQPGQEPASQPRRRRPVAVGASLRPGWTHPPKTLSLAAIPLAIRVLNTLCVKMECLRGLMLDRPRDP